MAQRTRLQAVGRSPLSLTLAGHAALAVAVFGDDGSIADIPVAAAATLLILVIVAVAMWGKALHATIVGAPIAREESARVAWIVAMGSTFLAFVRPPANHLRGIQGPFDALAVGAFLLVATYAVDLLGHVPAGHALVTARRAILLLIALALGATLLKASPDPPIDVFPLHQMTAQALLAGKPIYKPGVLDVLDTFHGTYFIRSYVYLPLTAYLTTIAYAATHDTRWANLASQLVAGVLLWLVAERCARRANEAAAGRRELEPDAGSTVAPGIWADLVAIALLFHPRELLVLEKAWVEPMALPFLGGFVLAAVSHRRVVANVCLGLLCAAKQHLVLYLPFLVLVPGVGISGLVIAGAVALATVAPYLLSSPRDLFQGAFVSIASTPFRTDALALPAALSFVGVMIPPWVGFLAALAPLRWIRRVPREVGPLLLGSCMMFGLFYVLGRQAFCNYYYLLDATSLFAVAALTAPPATGQAGRSTLHPLASLAS
jgi:hypothetical protein